MVQRHLFSLEDLARLMETKAREQSGNDTKKPTFVNLNLTMKDGLLAVEAAVYLCDTEEERARIAAWVEHQNQHGLTTLHQVPIDAPDKILS